MTSKLEPVLPNLFLVGPRESWTSWIEASGSFPFFAEVSSGAPLDGACRAAVVDPPLTAGERRQGPVGAPFDGASRCKA